MKGYPKKAPENRFVPFFLRFSVFTSSFVGHTTLRSWIASLSLIFSLMITISCNRMRHHKQNNMNLLQTPFFELNKSIVWTGACVLGLKPEVVLFVFPIPQYMYFERCLDFFIDFLKLCFFLQCYYMLYIKKNKSHNEME